ncbi:bcl-2 homologous antagonist/killer-like [Clytia hemisphaerica]|uniref:Bcl-2 Bcl-2 homology region 1-3 domain-containing protein n=1 Tax=Clytia hemisphaerica TaxID=252671 RepID=A0A7M5UJI6_9CNID
MAAAAPDPNDDPNEFFKRRPPYDKDVSFDQTNLEEDQKQVAEESEKIFKTFLYTRLLSDIERDSEDGEMCVGEITTPVIHQIRDEKTNMEEKFNQDEQDKKILELGQMLAAVGDNYNKKYDFQSIVGNLNIEHEEFAYTSFTNVARKLVVGGLNWGRILALFLFGYEIALSFLRKGHSGVYGLLKRILKYMVKFLFKEGIVNWIIEQGGWIKFKLQENRESVNYALMILASLLAGYGAYRLYNR